VSIVAEGAVAALEVALAFVEADILDNGCLGVDSYRSREGATHDDRESDE
jgi:hypothetical protein